MGDVIIYEYTELGQCGRINATTYDKDLYVVLINEDNLNFFKHFVRVLT